MLKNIQNLNKRTKIIIIGVLSFVLLIGGTGIVLYARDRQRQEQFRQELLTLYESISVPKTDEYNDNELKEHKDLLAQKEEAFNSEDMSTLTALQSKLDELQKRVENRLKREENERKAKEEAEQQTEQVEREAQEKAQSNVNHYDYSANNINWSDSSPSYSGSSESNSGSGSNSSNNSWENDAPSWLGEGNGSGCAGSSCWGDWKQS